jgi:glutathione S-transferase
MLQIYANRLSAPCNKVRYTCNALAIPYEWIEMPFEPGALKTPEYLAIHPAGKVPAMDDDGFRLFESDAICRYLCAKHPGDLMPADVQDRAIMDQWLNFSANHVGLAMSKVLFNRVAAPKYGLPIDETSLREGLQWLDRYLPIVDHRLQQSAYLAGPWITLADLTLLSIVERAHLCDISLTPYPRLQAWLEEMQAQDFWREPSADP